ncbi:MAG: GNAT family N-acetyltransferase [Streptosporangiaceae bacterium]
MIRPARPEDVPEILAMIRELATYERAPEQVEATEEALHAALFGPEPAVFCHLAEHDGAGVAGFALWFLNFSTWLGSHGVHLEDLFVRPTYRRHGYATALLRTLAAIAVAGGYGRLEWAVLDWNTDAHGFYRAIGAAPMDEWTTWRATGDALRRLADEPHR